MRVFRRTGALLGLGTVAACLVAVGLLSITGNDFVVAGLRGTDLYASYGLPVVRVLAEVSAVVCVGGLLLPAFLLPVPERAPVRIAGWAAGVWAMAALLSVPFTLADVYARPLSYVLAWDRLVELAFAVEPTRAWMVTAVIAVTVTAAAPRVTSQRGTRALLGLALFGLVPVASSGHSSTGGDHDWASASLLTHLVAAALWVGGLLAILAHRTGEHLTTAVTRFSALALWCWIALAASGVINALVRVSPANLVTTSYGLLVVAKILALLLLGVFGFGQRRTGVAEVVRTGTSRALAKLGAVEILLMSMTIGLATALARTPPPEHVAIVPPVELKLGYVLSGPPDALALLTGWRFDLLLGTGAIVLAALGTRRPGFRLPLWLAGCAGVVVATSSGIGRYAPAVFSLHVASTVIIAIVSPALLVLGMPRTWRVVLNPVLVTVLFAGSFAVVHFTGVFEWSLGQPIARAGVNLWFLLSGAAFFSSVLTPAIPLATRRLMVFGALAAQVTFAVVWMVKDTVPGVEFYRSLKLPWIADWTASQQLGGAILIGFGAVPLLVTGLVLLVTPHHARAHGPRVPV